MDTIKISNWSERHEVSQSRKAKRLSWIPFPVDLSIEERRLISQDGGLEAFAVYSLLVRIAANMSDRGTLETETGPISAKDISIITGLKESIIKKAISILMKDATRMLVADYQSTGSALPIEEKREEKKEEKKEDHCVKLDKSQTEAFDKFWTAYPRKVAKGQARKAWKKLPKSVTVDQLIAAIEAQLADRASAPRGSFVPEWKHASTWLNGECWTDEPLFANQLAIPASNPDDEIYGFDAYYPSPRIAWQNAQNDAGLTTYVEIDSPELQNRLKNVNTACSRHFSEPSRLRPLLFAKTAENGSESPQIVFPSKIVLEEFRRLVFDLREVEPENESIQAPFDAAVGKVKEGKDQSNG